MLETEGIDTYESSQTTNACSLFPFSADANSKAYHDLSNESLEKKLQGKSI